MTDGTNNEDQENQAGDNNTSDASGSGDASSSESSSTQTAVTTSALNQQIVQAVDKTNQVVLGAAETEANGVGYQKVAQAAAFSVQDSTDYMRNIMTIAATTQGVCLQLMISEETTSPYADIMTQAQNAVTAAQKNFEAVGTSASKTLEAFPSS